MLFDALKEGTRAHHARAEHGMPLLAPDLTVAGYRRTLAALLGLHRPLERRLARLAGPGAWPAADLAERARTPLLAADLRALGLDAAGVRALPDCDALPPVESPADLLGVLYVLEGATLGGQVVRRHLLRVLPAGLAERSTRFFAGHGERTGPMWKAFRAAATARAEAERVAVADVVAAAARTFDAFGAWMRRRGVAPAAVGAAVGAPTAFAAGSAHGG